MVDFTFEFLHIIFHKISGGSLTIGAPHCSSIVFLNIEEFLIQLKSKIIKNEQHEHGDDDGHVLGVGHGAENGHSRGNRI